MHFTKIRLSYLKEMAMVKSLTKLCFIIFSIIIFNGCATTVATLEQEKSLEEIKAFPGISQEDLYKKTLSWLAINYNSANDVIQFKDPDTGQIICKGMGSISMFGEFYYKYTMIIDIKKEKIRIKFKNIHSVKVGNAGATDVYYNWGKISKNLNLLKENLFLSINKKVTEENW